ncbi:TPA: hypothetical protein KZS56_004896 [Escherichia coli]|nr:hypothetical protein [Escherichia coli]
MKFIVKALICLAVMLSFTANAAEYKEYPQGEITYYKYLPRNGWKLPAGYTVEQFSSAIYKGQIRNNFPWTNQFIVRGNGVLFLANKVNKTWHVLPVDYQNLNFGRLTTHYQHVNKGDGCYFYILDGHGSDAKPILRIEENCVDMKMYRKMVAEKKEREQKANQWPQQQILAEHCRRYGNC